MILVGCETRSLLVAGTKIIGYVVYTTCVLCYDSGFKDEDAS